MTRRFLLLIISLLPLFLSSETFATITLSQYSGASNVDLTDPTKPIMYGGFAGTCDGAAGVSATCDSCTTGPLATNTAVKLFPCNKTNVLPSTILSLTFTTTAALTAEPDVHFNSSSGASIGTVSSGSVGATTFTVTVPWSDICSNFSGSDGGACTSEVNAGIFISTTSGSGTSDTITVKVVSHFADTSLDSTTGGPNAAWNYADCKDTDTNPAGTGFCHFSVFPGDQKIYIEDLAGATGFPATKNSASLYTYAVFFAEAMKDGEQPSDTLARISNQSTPYQIGINSTTNVPSGEWIGSFTNGTKYCVVMASQDATGVINFFTPSTAVPDTELCTNPEPVVGLLDDKHCFIATAAFGSDMAPEVQSFREFRNKFLLPHSWGKKFVQGYYKHSPKYANMIAGSETAKFFARGFLWPLLLFARMSVAFGFWVTMIILSVALLSFVELYRRLFLRRSVRGEL